MLIHEFRNRLPSHALENNVPTSEPIPRQVETQNVNEPTISGLRGGNLLIMMRSVAGGHFFSYSEDGGATWSKPCLSPPRRAAARAHVGTVPSSGNTLAILSRGLTGRAPVNSAIARGKGKSRGALPNHVAVKDVLTGKPTFPEWSNG